MSDNSFGNDTNQDIAYLFLGGLAVLILTRLWSQKVKPVLESVMPSLRSGKPHEVLGMQLATADLIGAGVSLVAVLAIVGLLRGASRRRPQRSAERRDREER